MLLGALLTAGAALIAFHVIPVQPGSLQEFLGGDVGTLFFGLGTILLAKRLLTIKPDLPVVTLSPAGIRDARISVDTIPWPAINRVSAWQMHRQKFVVLAIDPAVEASLTRPRAAGFVRGTNKAFGIDGLTVSAVGLKTNHAALMAAILAYAGAWGTR